MMELQISKFRDMKSDNNFFQPETLTRLKLMVYCMSDALKTDEGKELTELCIDNDIEDLSAIVDEKLREFRTREGDN